MSGAGKSYWARQLHERCGYAWHDCDRDIADRLGELVQIAAGEEAVHAVGRWMGMPYEAGYHERERRYLALEAEVTQAALDRCAAGGASETLDTTGSVVHLAAALRAEIHRQTLVVYLRTPPSAFGRMLQRYLEEPKPVAWGGLFDRASGERPEAALARSYPELLRERDRRYRSMAHVTLDAAAIESEGWTLDRFLGACGRALPPS